MAHPEPVESQSTPDPSMTTGAPLVPDRVVILLTMFLAAVLLIAVVVSLVFWHTPSSHPIELPVVGQA